MQRCFDLVVLQAQILEDLFKAMKMNVGQTHRKSLLVHLQTCGTFKVSHRELDGKLITDLRRRLQNCVNFQEGSV